MTTPPSRPKIALVTGANSGIGRVTAVELAQQGHRVFLACRSEEKTRPVLAQINSAHPGAAEFLPLDLADLDSVRACAARFLDTGLPLPLLVCNAGIAGTRGMTKQGFELTFGVCHLGHFLLTQLLLPRIEASAPARIVVVASRAHKRIRGLDFATLRRSTPSRTGVPEYCAAKLANVLFASELARRLQGRGVNVYSLHPGVVATEVWRAAPRVLQRLAKPFMKNEHDGAATTLHCATSPAVAGESGLYYADCRPIPPSPAGRDAALARRLWGESERWVAAA